MLLIASGSKITVGKPAIDGARVVATSHGDGKGKKAVVFKYKSKCRYIRKTGHRQPFTRLSIDRIIGPGIAEGEPAKKTRRRKKEVTQDGS